MHRAQTSHIEIDTGLINALLTPAAFDHPVAEIELLETHISWLILAGDYAYKIKKPLVLDFLDFGDPAKRRFYCEEELRLNQPWAPDIYLDVVPIVLDDGGQARIGGPGEAVEYALRMRRFEQALRLDRQLEDGRLTVADMKELAVNIAWRHQNAPRVEAGQRARVLELTGEFMLDNFRALEGQIDGGVLKPLHDWTVTELARHEALLGGRFDDGLVRDCHGDLHLGNLVRLADGITTFDCIEFNTDLRHIDVMCDIAFLVMDLVASGRDDLAAHFLNRYLEATGDYGGVQVLNLFFVYRCLVRAKVAVIRSRERDDADRRQADLDEARFYCKLASHQAQRKSPVLVIMYGLSGSGKTWVSGQLMAALPAIRIRSDIERKRLFGIGETASSRSAVGGGIYTKEASREVYHHLLHTGRMMLAAGHSVILDAAFLAQAERAEALRMAKACDCPAVIVDVNAPAKLLRERISRRMKEEGTVSEARLDVLEHQLASAEMLTAAERKIAIRCDNVDLQDVDFLARAVRDAASRQA